MIYGIAVQPDGKLVIGGVFETFNSVKRDGIARLNADGSLDTTFDPSAGVRGEVNTVAIQQDGKVVIGGRFTSVDNTTRNRIARLNIDGSLDSAFDPGLGANSWVRAIAIQPDGKIVIGGFFTSVNGTTRNRIARLNTDGSLDATFDPGIGASDGVHVVAVQQDGKLIIGGGFLSFNGVARNSLARLNSDGSLDSVFDPGGAVGIGVEAVAIQPDGKLVIGGQFDNVNGSTHNRITRLNADGSLDMAFDPGMGTTGLVFSVALQQDGKLVIGGQFNNVDGTTRNNIARLNFDGNLETTFDPGEGANDWVYALVPQQDGKLVIGGSFTSMHGTARNHIARLNSDGSLDTPFDPDANDSVLAVVARPDGKLVIGGTFTSVDGISRSRIARLNSDGSLDTTFDPGTGTETNGRFNVVNAVALQPDGKLVIAGQFTNVNGVARNNIARLNADGSVDTTFDPGTGAPYAVLVVVSQSNGKLVIGGEFTSINGSPHYRIARLNADGSLDTSFDPGTVSFNGVHAIAVQSDGKLVIGGFFDNVNGTPRNGIARLNADGSLDTIFNPSTGGNQAVVTVAIQPNGKILIGGPFTSVNGTSVTAIARLNVDGSLDTTFDSGAGTNNTVLAISTQSDGKILIGGGFTSVTSVNGTTRNRVARISVPEAALQSVEAADSGQSVDWLRSGVGPVLSWTSIETSSDGSTWASTGNGERISGGWRFNGLNLPFEVNTYVRVRGYVGTNIYSSGSIVETVKQIYLPQPTCNFAPTPFAPIDVSESTTPTFAWSGIDDCEWYQVYVRDNGGNLVYQTWYTDTQTDCDNDTSCEVTPTKALDAGRHAWWVRGWSSSEGATPWSTSNSFDVNVSADCTTAMTTHAPLNTAGTLPTYQWTGRSGCTWYQLWTKNEIGNVYIDWYTAAAAECDRDLNCEVTPSTTLDTGSHTWWVRGWNSVSGHAPWSTGKTFNVTANCDAALTLIAPNSTIPDTTPMYSWSGNTTCTWYQLWTKNENSDVYVDWYRAAAAECEDDTSCEVTPLTELGSGSYTWWIRGWSSTSGHAPWSDGTGFTLP